MTATEELPLDDRRRRLRAKNWALLVVLGALALLFYVITMVRIGSHP